MFEKPYRRKELRLFTNLSVDRMFFLATFVLLWSFSRKVEATSTLTVQPNTVYYEEGTVVNGTCTYLTDELNDLDETESSKVLIKWLSTYHVNFPYQDEGRTTWNGTHRYYVRSLTFRAQLRMNCNDYWCGTAHPADVFNTFYVVKSVRTPQKAVATYHPEVRTWVCETTETTSAPPRIFWKDENGNLLTDNINETLTPKINDKCELNTTYLLTSAITVDEGMENSKLYCEVLFQYENIYKNLSSRESEEPEACMEKNLIITEKPDVMEGGTVSMCCEVYMPFDIEIPFPLRWVRPGGFPKDAKFRESHQYSQHPLQKRYELQVTFKAVLADNGTTVTCYMNESNFCGNESAELFIKKSSISVEVTGPDLVNASQTYTWDCVSNGNSLAEPQHLWRDSYSMLLTSVEKLSFEREEINALAIFTVRSRLTLAIPPKSPSYSVTCQVIEEGTFDSKSEAVLNIAVQFPPQVIRPGGSVQLRISENKPVILPCRITSNPPITAVSWAKNGESLQRDPERYEGSTVDAPSLTIKRPQFNDSGTYTCAASNDLGSSPDSDPVVLIIGYMPKMEYSNLQYKCDKSHAVVLPCPVHATPNISEVTWKKVVNSTTVVLNVEDDPRYSGLEISRQKYDLHITNPEPGEYFCVARNSFGSTNGERLTVQCSSSKQPLLLKDVISEIVTIVVVLAATCLCVGLLVGYAVCGGSK